MIISEVTPRASTIRRYEITDAEWENIKPYVPEEQKAGARERPCKDSRTMLNGIFWILQSEVAWRDIPERYGSWQTVSKRFAKWFQAGISEKIFKDLTADADMQDIRIDSTCIKAHKASAGAKREILTVRHRPQKSMEIASNLRRINVSGSLMVVKIPRSMQWWTHWAIRFMFNFPPETSTIRSLQKTFWSMLT